MSGFDSRPGGVYRSISLGAMPAVAEKAPELLRDAGSRTGFGAHFWNLPINAAFHRRADGSVSFHPWPWPLRKKSAHFGADIRGTHDFLDYRYRVGSRRQYVGDGRLGDSADRNDREWHSRAYRPQALQPLRIFGVLEPAAIDRAEADIIG